MKENIPESIANITMCDYTYALPESRIAKYPLEERNLSKLLVYHGGEIEECMFNRVTDILGSGQLLVFNNTKVIYARLFFKKDTGAQIEIFCLEPYRPSDYALNFAATGHTEWKCIVGNLKKWKEGVLVSEFDYGGSKVKLEAKKTEVLEGGEVVVRFSWNGNISFSRILDRCGSIPIPPYLNREAEKDDRVRYQTVYSKEEGSVAAPTAGLHFTKEIIDTLLEKGVEVKELTLHVGAGTFRPVKAEYIGGHEMHTEHIAVSRDLIGSLMNSEEGKVVAVGTTSVRTLESIYWMGVKLLEGRDDFNTLSQWEVYSLPADYSVKEAMVALYRWFEKEEESELKASTTIIIVPSYKFRLVGAFFTNFHQPQSTLLLLVAAAIGEDWKRVYRYAMEHDFRFLSYGDSSFLEVRKQ